MDRKQQMLSNMYTFAVAGKCLSFTKAAEELFITQGAVASALSHWKNNWVSAYLCV